jgi:hypothetical protein
MVCKAPRLQAAILYTREYLRGKYHCTIELLFDWFGLVCFAITNKKCPLSYSRFQTSQTGGQWYSDTSPFSIPCLYYAYLCSWSLQQYIETILFAVHCPRSQSKSSISYHYREIIFVAHHYKMSQNII